MGPSGSGKSTLMHCCAALDTADSGSVFIGEQDLTALKDKALTRLRRDEIGFVFQSYNLVPTLTAEENILLPHGDRRPQARPRVVRRGDRHRRPRRPAEPQAQRALRRPAAAGRGGPGPGQPARGSSSPTSPPATSTPAPAPRCSSCCGAASTSYGQTVVMVTHDPVAAAYTDRVVFLADGRVVDELREPDPGAGARRSWPGWPTPPTHRRRAWAPAMIRAALKSLLGRKVRLLMSTFAIVLGVAFVAGSLVFSDTLSRSFTALFASTVGDVVVRPAGGTHASSGAPSTRDRPRVAWSTELRAAARAPPASTATSAPSASSSSAGTTARWSAASGRRRSAATGPTRPAGHGLEGLVDHPGPRAARPGRGGARRPHRRRAAATPLGDQVAARHGRTRAVADRPSWSASPASRRAAR